MQKRYLSAAGPAGIPPEVLLEMAGGLGYRFEIGKSVAKVSDSLKDL
jgi:hypothetical protein